jgi:hypothetical protein
VCAFACDGIFRYNLNFSFHGSAARVSYFRIEDDKIADLDRFAEDHRVNGYCDNALLRMTHTGERSRFIYKFHDPSTVHIAKDISMFGVHHLRNADA